MIHKGMEFVRVDVESIDSTKKTLRAMKIPHRVIKVAIPHSMILSKKTFFIKQQLFIQKDYEEKFKNCIV